MAISTEQVTGIISNQFATAEEFAQVIALLGGISARLKLEIQRDAANRAIGELAQQQQTVSQTKQAELNAAIAELNQAIAAKQQEAQTLQAQIDAINAQLPALLQSEGGGLGVAAPRKKR